MADILRFGAKITEETLIASTRLHNQLPPDSPFPQVDVLSDGFKEVCAIIAKYNVQSHFRLRLLHRHRTIPEGQILLGTRTTKPLGYWTRPIRISDIDSQKIHPHIISINTSSCTTEDDTRILDTSEFREGPPVSVGNIDSNFFAEFTDCLWAKGWENTLGLEAIRGWSGKMIEFSFDVGSLLVKEEDVKAEVREEGRGQFKLQETGWAVTIEHGAVRHIGEVKCVKAGGEHRPVAVPDEVTKVSDVVQILRDRGILAM